MTYFGGAATGLVRLRERTTPGLSLASEGLIYFDSVQQKFLLSENGGAYVAVNGTVSSGWTAAGAVVKLTTATDQVGVGTATPSATSKVEIDASSGAFANGLKVSNGTVSCPGAGLNSQRFGLDTTADGEDDVAVGHDISIVSVGCVAVGAYITLGAATDNSVAIGNGVTASSYGGFVAIGQGVTSSFDAVAIGANTIAGDGAISVGTNVNNPFTSIALGGYSYTTANFQFTAGRSIGNGNYAKDVYFGAGLRAPTDFSDYTIHGTGGYFAAVVADPGSAPTGTVAAGAATLTPGTYQVQYTYVARTANGDPLGETLPSPLSTAFTITTLGEKIVLDPIANPGGNAVELKIYVESAPASGVFLLYGNASFAAAFDINGPGTGAAPPVSNTTGNDGHGHILTVRGGDADAAGTGDGASLVLSGGDALGATGNAGSTTVQGGTPTDGNGGSVTVSGSAGVGTDRDGGSVVISPGANTGTGTAGTVQLCTTTAQLLRFYGSTTGTAQQTVTGSRGGNAALASLLTALATLGLIVDSTTA